MTQDPKTFQLSETLAIAYCGSGRLGQILMYHMSELEDPPLGMDEHKWAVKMFVEHMRGVLYNMGHLHVTTEGEYAGVEHLGGSAFLLAVRGRVFNVQEDFDVMEHQRIYDALGSGEEVAMGAMAALLGDEVEPIANTRLQRIAEAGIIAASELTNYVGGNLTTAETVVHTSDEKALARSILRP